MRNKYIVIIIMGMVASGCKALITSDKTENITNQVTQTPQASVVVVTSTAIIDNAKPEFECAKSFDRRELREPYQKQHENEPRYTLSTDELEEYFSLMGIKTACVPTAFGAPFISVDWNSKKNPSVSGRMISISFEGLYSGAGWGDSYIVYSTYNFTAGTEYDRFASEDDLTAVNNGTMADVFDTYGVKGFERYHIGLGYESAPVFLTYVYPFASSYVAFVLKMGDYEGDIETFIDKFSNGLYPPELNLILLQFKQMARLVVFNESQ